MVKLQGIFTQLQDIQKKLPHIQNRDTVAGVIEQLAVLVTTEMDSLNLELSLLQDELLTSRQTRRVFGKTTELVKKARKLCPKNTEMVEVDSEITALMRELGTLMLPHEDEKNSIVYDQVDLDEVNETLGATKASRLRQTA